MCPFYHQSQHPLFFPCIMNSFWILFSEYPNVVQEFYSAILLFKLVVRISMGQCDVFVSEWCYILVVWNCEHERWEMTSYQPCEVKVCTTILNFKFWMSNFLVWGIFFFNIGERNICAICLWTFCVVRHFFICTI